MAAGGPLSGLIGQQLSSTTTFNWTWFIELIVAGILVLWFTFYLDRLLATTISYAIRAYSWHAFRVYIDIKSLQISFLGGRIFFKGVRYHGENETVYIHNGYITWRYWLRATRQICLGNSPSASDSKEKSLSSDEVETDEPQVAITGDSVDELPEKRKHRSLLSKIHGRTEARIGVNVSGLEWFIYNRTPVYDSILQEVDKQSAKEKSGNEQVKESLGSSYIAKLVHKQEKSELSEPVDNEDIHEKDDATASPDSSLEKPRRENTTSSYGAFTEEAPATFFYAFILRFFPVEIECSKGAVSLGNEHTRALIVTTFSKARGHIDAAASGAPDIFRQLFDFDIENTKIQMKPNPDYHLPQMLAAERLVSGLQAPSKRRPWWQPRLDLGRRRRKLTSNLRNLLPRFRRSVESLHPEDHSRDEYHLYSAFNEAQPDTQNWHGLDRYFDEDEADDHQAWINIEYARFSSIVECPRIHMVFYWDTPGQVEPYQINDSFSGSARDANGVSPPDYGMTLDVHGGTVNYGPWADRLRQEFQGEFLPANYRTAEPIDRLQIKEYRLSTIMDININVREELTLRVPCREGSKDWKWRGRATAVRDAAALKKQQERRHFRFGRSSKRRQGPDVRPFGWLAVSTGAGTNVRYTMDMYAGSDGFTNSLYLDLVETKATSSVNHNVLWRCLKQIVNADISNPLGWNDMHIWHFDIKSTNMDLFLLRDHCSLLLDLISDFTAGQKSDYMTFMPFKYILGIDFENLQVHLNANDHNIIDNPTDMNENIFMILGFAQLLGKVDIPMDNFDPPQSSVNFNGDGSGITFKICTPPWNTLHEFGNDDTTTTLKAVHLSGSYNYYADTTPELTDSLIMDIHGEHPKFVLQGFLIRYFMNVKDNYFGDTINFSTFEEFQARLEKGGEDDKKAPPKKMNDLDVILNVRADNVSALLPANIYQRAENLRIDVLLAEADMRFTNYYMDLQVNTSPIEASLETRPYEDVEARPERSSCQLCIDLANIYGHRLFGAPPAEPAYLSNWDVDVGMITGECSSEFLRIAIAAVMSLMFTMDDDENALPKLDVMVVPDVIFLRVRAAGIRHWIIPGDGAILLDVAPVTVDLNDWANRHFSQALKVNVPSILFALVDSAAAYRQRDTDQKVVPSLACIKTSLRLAVLDKKVDFEHNVDLQQEHIRFNDSRTGRAQWSLHDSQQEFQPTNWSRLPPAMSLPCMPQPLSRSEIRSGADVSRQETSKHEASRSFLSPKGLANERSDAAKYSRNSSADGKLGSHSLKPVVSSAWARPKFQLQDIRPDLSLLPDVDISQAASNPLVHETNENIDNVDDENTDAVHQGVFVVFDEGLAVLLTPRATGIVIDLLNGLAPTSAESILDDIQMQTLTNVRKFTGAQISQITDVALSMPAMDLRVLNYHQPNSVSADFDEFGCKLHVVKMTLRTSPVAHSHTVRQNIMLNLSLQSMRLESSVFQSDQCRRLPGAELEISQIGVWLSAGLAIRARTQINGVEFVTAGDNIKTLARLLERTEKLASGITQDIDQLNVRERAQRAIYDLVTTMGNDEPAFWNKSAYIFRAASNHARTHSSWRTLTRLRNGLRLQRKQGETSELHRLNSSLDEVRMPAKRIRATFAEWQGLDDSSNNSRAVEEAIFGISDKAQEHYEQSVDVETEILIRAVTIKLDPGPRQSLILLNGLDLNVSEKPTPEENADWTFQRRASRSRTIQSYSGGILVQLHWELLNLVESAIVVAQPYMGRSQSIQQTQTTDASPSININLIVVLGVDAAAIEFTTPNIRLMLGVESLRTSVMSSSQKSGLDLSIALAAAAMRTKLTCRNCTVLIARIVKPNIYLKQLLRDKISGNLGVVHLAVSSQSLRLYLKQDIRWLLQCAEYIVQDEVKTVHKLLSEFPATFSSSISNPDPQIPKVELHIALFLHDYLLQLDLMPYLRYSISGEVARASVESKGPKHLITQIDLKNNQHSFSDHQRSAGRPDTVIMMPPIHVIASLKLEDNRFILDVQSTIDKLRLEASAVRACFDAAYKPQTVEYIRDVKQCLAQLQSAIPIGKSEDLSKDPVPVDGSGRTLQYRGHMVLEGVEIHCSASAIRQNEDYKADLTLILDTTVASIYNDYAHRQDLSKTPQFEFTMREIVCTLEKVKRERLEFGRLSSSFSVSEVIEPHEDGREVQQYRFTSDNFSMDVHAETAVLAVDIITFLQDRIKSLAAAEDAKKLKPLRRLTLVKSPEYTTSSSAHDGEEIVEQGPMGLLDVTFALELNWICLRWIVSEHTAKAQRPRTEDMVISIQKIDLTTKREGSARLSIQNLQLQLVPKTQRDLFERTENSALLPEMVFSAAYARSLTERKFAFKAAGKELDIQLASNFIVPAAQVQSSLAAASTEVRNLKSDAVQARESSSARQAQLPKLLGGKRLASLLVYVDFAGARITVTAAQEPEQQSSAFSFLKGPKRSRAGRYGQAVQSAEDEAATLRSPGIALQVQYNDKGSDDPTLSTEIKVAASSNTLAPSVVPLILEISSSISSILSQEGSSTKVDRKQKDKSIHTGYSAEAIQQATDPTAILGKVRLNAGLWVQKQEFSLTCQPIARVSATAKFNDIFLVINTVQAKDEDRFFSIMITLNKIAASVQHVYSRESTARFDVDSIVVSLMNSKHFSDKSGISAILNVSPMVADFNAKQLQDFLLFREIWYPAELRAAPAAPPAPRASVAQGAAIQRFQEVTTAGRLPWHAIVSIQEMKVLVDFGQSIGKSDFAITKLWASSKKTSDSEQNLCVGFERIGIENSGRLSGFVELQKFKIRTAIRWPVVNRSIQAPLVQGSVGFDHLRAKLEFDYQPFAVIDISDFAFLMYNVRQGRNADRLVGILDGGKIQAFIIATAAAQVLSIYQAFERLIQDKEKEYEGSLVEVDRLLKRKSVFPSSAIRPSTELAPIPEKRSTRSTTHAPNLHVDVVIMLKQIDGGIFMTTFFDETILKLGAQDIQARFAVGDTNGKTHSGLGMRLGEVRLALSSLNRPNTQALADVDVTEVIGRATAARGGTILKVPELIASMETWQREYSSVIEYIFSSIFKGKVDVGWNYSRISRIRQMWDRHSAALASKLGKPLPQSALKITAEPSKPGSNENMEKITAVVNMPTSSKYQYVALEPPTIDTPQLRDLGEATPSLDWVGLHREKLPNVVHSVIIMALLGVCREVEDSYDRILGSG